MDRYYALKNFSATHLMALVGKDFDWKNTTIVMYSNNVANCERTAKFILQGVVKEEDVKKQVDARVPPDYRKIAEAIVPKFIDRDVREQILFDVVNVTAINEDSDIQSYNDSSMSLYQTIYADGETVLNSFILRIKLFIFRYLHRVEESQI